MTRRLQADRSGVVAAEFAVCGSLVILILILVFVTGLMGWTKVALQAAAATTARCVALGSTACATPSSYAVTQVSGWLFPGAVTSSNVSVSTATTCNGATGHYAVVTITSTAWSSMLPSTLPAGLSTPSITATSCYVSSL